MNTRGLDVLSNPRTNKGTAFTLEERQQLELTGLLPPVVCTQAQQVERSLRNFRSKKHGIDKYLFLSALQKRNERVFYKILVDYIEEVMPFVYTPTVGQACQDFAVNFRETHGCYISWRERGRIADVMSNWPEKDVRLIVVTDGERILGLGDLGSNGMGIPIGKLSLYCACAGIDPAQCLPIMLDVGTENDELREDPYYLGLRQKRIRGDDYFGFVDEFVQAVKRCFPKALLQFEDFATPNAVKLLERYHDELLCFNDDIQGTASVALAGMFAATRITKKPLKEMRFMFLGAGSAATGIGELLVKAMVREGVSEQQARSQLVFNDSKGLIVKSRDALTDHARPFAADMPAMDAGTALRKFKPHALIGASGRPGLITQDMVEFMCEQQEHPVIFALSNPTANAECTATQAYQWSRGQAIFASGSPFDPVEINGVTKIPGQGNNAYIFPGLGLGALLAKSTRINDAMLIAAADKLAECVSEERIASGCLYPPLKDIRQVSADIAVSVAQVGAECGLLKKPLRASFSYFVKTCQYDPSY